MKPRVRFLEIQPYGDKFLLRDPVGISPSFLVSPELVFILSFLDGSKDLREVQAEIFKRTGQLISSRDLEEVLKFLDENFLLYNERFLRKLNEEREKILKKGVREPSHAGEAYPDNPEELKRFIEEQLNQSDEKVEARGIIVPHMDLRVAGRVYGKVYSLIKENKYDVVLLLGVSHYFHEKPFSVLPLELKTPIGTLSVDRERINTLKTLFDWDIFHDVLAYKQEHSIEFQTIFLKHLFPDIKVIPAIVSYGDRETLKDIANKLSKVLEDAENPLIISSVDFSHVGRKFGDPASYDTSFRDKEYIKLLSELKNEEAFKLLESDNNRTRIDGQFTNFVFLEVLKNLGVKEGRLIDYEIYDEKPTDSKVSYAGLVFT
ncbi:AmmeMemoRadiSam system protein B [Aquifex pyrophilus]